MLVDHKYTKKGNLQNCLYKYINILDKYKELKLEVRRLAYMNILGTTI